MGVVHRPIGPQSETWTEIRIGDAVSMGPNEVHQLKADRLGPLGFIYVIPAWAKAAPLDAQGLSPEAVPV